jgi:crotonobetainyl-CoA:carnitine CoA-transferase CaiB-like acyl-CoA transferase
MGIAVGLCGKLLADAGARVLRMGSAAPIGVPYPEDWASFLGIGKESTGGDPEDALADADLYLTRLPHGHELGCDRVLERHPHLQVACVTPFGQTGFGAGLREDDVVLSALSGLADATPGLPDHAETFDDPPVQSLIPLAAAGGGLTAAVAVMGALLPRLRQDAAAPKHVEISSREAAVSLMAYEWGIAANDGGVRGRRPIPLDPAPNAYLPTRDGTAVIVAFSAPHWQALVELMGNPEWAADERWADGTSRAKHWDELEPRLRAWTAEQTGKELLERAQALGTPICSSFTLAEAVASAQVRVTGAVREVDGRRVAADPIVIDGRRRHGPGRRSGRRLPAPTGDAPLPLSGIRVIDFSQFVAGPYCGQLLAALGAEVTLVEPPGFPVSRMFGPFVGEPAWDASAMFPQVNRGKRSVQLDLRTDDGRALARELVRGSDVVLENFSREAAEKLGLTWDEISATRPDVVLASISGFGRTGPWGSYNALHSGVLLLSGSTDVTRDVDGHPRLAGAIYPDLLAGTACALAIEQALALRSETGRGCRLEVAMMDVLLTCMGGLVAAAARGERFGSHPTAHFIRTSESGGFVAVNGPLTEERANEVSQLSRAEAARRLREEGVAAAPVLDIEEVMRDPDLTARGFVLSEDLPVAGRRRLPAVPWVVDGRRPQLARPPRLGDATDEALAALAPGMTEALHARG